jgi:hypothetical protein
MSDRWFFQRDGQQFGPYTSAEVKKYAADGRLLSTDMMVREGRTDWKPASSYPKLFPPESSPSPPQAGPVPSVQAVGEGVAKAGKGIFNSMGKIAEKVGQLAAEATEGQEAGHGLENQPAIFLESEFFGGRTRIGSSIDSLSTFGGVIASGLLGWPYIYKMLVDTTSAWQFLPFTRTEFVKIILEQKLRKDKLIPVFVAWLVLLGISCIAGGILATAVHNLAILIIPVGYILSNVVACQMVVGMGSEGLHRSHISLSYGFPKKHDLLFGVSDAPVDQQMKGVLQLCQAISRAQFSRWDQMSMHSEEKTGVIGGVFSRLASLIPGSE